MVLTAGLGLIIAPISVAAYMYVPQHLRGAAIGLASLLRNEGSSVGTSLAQTIQIRREQFHTARVGEFLDPLNPSVNSFIEQIPRRCSCRPPAILRRATSWPGNPWPTFASSKRLPWRTSTFSGSPPCWHCARHSCSRS